MALCCRGIRVGFFCLDAFGFCRRGLHGWGETNRFEFVHRFYLEGGESFAFRVEAVHADKIFRVYNPRHTEGGVAASGTYTVDWDLTGDNGGRLETGVYIYRVTISGGSGGAVSKAKKLIIITR